MNFKNIFDSNFDAIKDESKNDQNAKLANKANELFKDKTFADEYKTVYTGAKIIKVATNLVSFFTAFFAALYVLQMIVGYHIALFASFLICGCLEVLKNSLWLSTTKNKLRYNKIGVGLFFLVTISFFSLGASVFGAYVMLDEIGTTQSANYTKQDSIIINEFNALNAQIAANNSTQTNLASGANLLSSTNKRTLSDMQKANTLLQARKDTLSKEIAAINNRLDTKQKQLSSSQNDKLSSTRLYLVCTSIIAEVLYLACSIFVLFYLYRVFVDTNQESSFKPFKTDIEQLTEQPQEQPRQPQEQPQEQPQPRAQIGFKKTVIDDSLQGVKFVLHNGKQYTKTAIQGNINANRSKIRKYKERNDTDKVKRYTANLETWQNYLKQIS